MNLAEFTRLQSELIEKVRKNDLEGVKACLETGISPDCELAGTPLILYAIQRELYEVADELFCAEANISVAYELSNWTVLHQLSATGRIAEIKNYYDFMDNVKAKDKNKGQDALMIALDNGHKEVFEFLLEKGLELRSQDKDGSNLFHYLAKAGWMDIFEREAPKYISLLQVKNKKGETPLTMTGLTILDFIKDEPEEEVASVEVKEEANKSVESVQVADEVKDDVKPKLGKLKGAKRL